MVPVEMSLPKPLPSEYLDYYARYIERVPDGDIVATLEAQIRDSLALLGSIAPEREHHRYAPDRWSVREVVGHIVDVERVMGQRALAMARGDEADHPGMEQDAWAAASNADERPLGDLAEEWEAVRRANVLLFRGLDAEMGARRGRASGFDFTVRSFPWIIAGHELHHRGILKERYLADHP